MSPENDWDQNFELVTGVSRVAAENKLIFDAYVTAGFTEQQTMTILCAMIGATTKGATG